MFKKPVFIKSNSYVSNNPIKASSQIPQWYQHGNEVIDAKTGSPILTSGETTPAMRGTPFIVNSLSSGFFLTTWVDFEIYENTDDGAIKLKYVRDTKDGIFDLSSDYGLLEHCSSDLYNTLPKPQDFGNTNPLYRWAIPYDLNPPKKYLTLITHPFNRYDLPFVTSTQAIDLKTSHTELKIPVFFKKRWKGIVKQGTPFAQIVFIKKEYK